MTSNLPAEFSGRKAGRPRIHEKESRSLEKFRRSLRDAVERMETRRRQTLGAYPAQRPVREIVVNQMVTLGFDTWDQTTLVKFLKGRRSASFDECLALARIARIPIEEMILPDQSVDEIRADAVDAWEGFTRALDRFNETLIVIATQRARFMSDTATLMKEDPAGERTKIEAAQTTNAYIPEMFSAWWALDALITSDFHDEFVLDNAALFYDRRADADDAGLDRRPDEWEVFYRAKAVRQATEFASLNRAVRSEKWNL